MASPNGQILILNAKKEHGEALAMNLRRFGLEVAVASSQEDAVTRLSQTPADMVICDTQLSQDTGVSFLSWVRKEFPISLRVLVENEPLKENCEALINKAGVCCIFRDGVEAEEVARLLALEGAVVQGSPISVDQTMGVDKLKEHCQKLEAENQVLSQQVQKLRDHIQHGQSPQAATSVKPNPAPDPEESARMAVSLSRAMEQLMNSEDIVLPVLPEVGLEVQKLVADENCSFEALAEKVELEQGLSARILQVSNSPMYAGLKRIRNLQQAVARLGLRETRNIVQAVVTQNLFHTRSKSLSNLMSKLWLHSLCAAYSNENIAQTLQIPDSRDFFMMGLLHDIGKLVVVRLVDDLLKSKEWADKGISKDILRGLMTAHHHDFGLRIMQKWQYSKSFEEVVSQHNDDANVYGNSEAVVVTYFSNLLTRKLGYSLVPYESPLLDSEILARALNMTAETRHLLEKTLSGQISKIRESYLPQ